MLALVQSEQVATLSLPVLLLSVSIVQLHNLMQLCPVWLSSVKVQRRLYEVWQDIAHRGVQMVPITTLGDTNNSGALRELGQGAFTREVDQAVADGDVDIGVHSLKDGPVHLDPAVQLVCVLPRDDPRDVLIGAKQLTSLGEREQVCQDVKQAMTAVLP